MTNGKDLRADRPGNFTARVDPSTLAKSGDEITVALDTNKIHIFDKETEKTITN